MNKKTQNIILLIVAAQLILTLAVFALPRAVRALPGALYVRLQNNPLTSGVMHLVITPIPTALPLPETAVGGTPRTTNIADLPQIPGLMETVIPTATPSHTPTTLPTVADATPVPPTATPTPTPSPTPAPLPPTAVIEGLTTVRQGFNNCGPANLTIVLNYYGDATTQEDAAAYLKPNREDRNVSPWQISDYVNEFTALRSTVHSGGNLDMLRQFIAAGFPVVIEKGYEPNNAEGWYGHYLTVYGYDDTKSEIYTRDTNLGPFDGTPRIDDYADFLYWWQQFNYTFYVIYRPEQEAQVMAIVPDVLEDAQTMWQYVGDLAREEIAADPNNAFAYFNLGVSLTRLGEFTGDAAYYQSGAQAFDQARQIGLPPRTLYYEHRPLMAYWKIGRIDEVLSLVDTLLETPGGPYVEEIYWFQGHALAAEGELVAARDAYENALKVNPNFYPAQQSLDWVNSILNG